MIRKIKLLGLLTVAALAMSSMIASGAWGQEGTITAGETPETHTTTTVTGTQVGSAEENYFQASGVKISCPASTGVGEAVISGGEATSVMGVVNVLSGEPATCGTASNPESELVTIESHGCEVRVNQPVTTGSEEYDGTGDLICPEEKGLY